MASFFFRERGRFALLSVITVLILSLGACDSGSGITMTYEVGDTGPSGGIVFYDNGSYTTDSLGNSWRYLECASADLDPGIPWGPNDTTTVTTSNSVGTGAANTSAIITAYGAATAANCAAKAWDEYSQEGYSDWFLPSPEELDAIYNTLVQQGLGSFVTTSGSFYWSSRQYSSAQVYACLLYANGGTRWFVSDPTDTHLTFHTRPVRAF